MSDMNVSRGCSANSIYVSDDYFLVGAVLYHTKQLEEALKYCKHSKQKHQLQKKLKFWRELLDK